MAQIMRIVYRSQEMLVISNLIFSNNVFKTSLHQGHQHLGLFGKMLTLYLTKKKISTKGRRLLKIFWEKEKMLVTSIFSFSQHVFYNTTKKSILESHLFCHLQMLLIWTSVKFHCLVKGLILIEVSFLTCFPTNRQSLSS